MTNVLEGLNSLGIIYTLFAVCGLAVLANLVVLLVIGLNKTFRGTTEVFMGNMAVSDLLLAGIAIPIRMAQAVTVATGNRNFVGGTVACKLSMFIPNFTIASSILTMAAVSFDRYFSIVHHRKLSHRGLVATLVAIWVMSVISSSPQLYEYSIGTKVEGEGSSSQEMSAEDHGKKSTMKASPEAESAEAESAEQLSSVTGSYENSKLYSNSNETAKATYISCGSHDIAANFETIYASIFVIVIYLLPLLLICANYLNIVRFLWRVAKQTEASGSAGAVSKGKVKVVRMLAIVTGVFAVLWAPYFVLFTMEEVTGTDDSADSSSLPHTIKQTAVALSTISNPVLYYVFNDKYKRAAISAVTCGKVQSGQIRDMEASATQVTQVTQVTAAGT